uniref:Uncharacterized protein n=1 Tax=Arundo donax TaxID=35708 RepID=A0A0A9HPY5_ARUDO
MVLSLLPLKYLDIFATNLPITCVISMHNMLTVSEIFSLFLH